MTVGVISLGCSKNRVDTELMLGILKDAGFALTNDEREAEVLIVNTCGFIESAKQESIDTLLEMAEYKKSGKLKLLVATGCLSQRYESELLTLLPEVDLLLGVSSYPALPGAIERALSGVRAAYCEKPAGILTGPRVLTTPPYTAYVRIADGCDNRCAYCAIPLIRGGFRSRDMDGVLAEIRTLAESGVKEHVLVAQDTSRFGVDICGHSLLPELMARAADIPGVEWLRVLYCYPDEIDARLLDVMCEKPNICKYLDLPLQHADPALLLSMNRRGDITRTREFLKEARRRGFTLRTTMMTGFPGETDAQFEALMDFIKDIRFDRLGAFAYSAEEGTPASDMPRQVPEEIKQSRLDALMRAQAGISRERNEKRIGARERVLIESVTDGGLASARSEAEAPETDGTVFVAGCTDADMGQFREAVIERADTYDLWGVLA